MRKVHERKSNDLLSRLPKPTETIFWKAKDDCQVRFLKENYQVEAILGRANPWPGYTDLEKFVTDRATRIVLKSGTLEVIILDLDAMDSSYEEGQTFRWMIRAINEGKVDKAQLVDRKKFTYDTEPSDHECLVLYLTNPNMIQSAKRIGNVDEYDPDNV